MAFFVEYEPDDKKYYDESYSRYDLINRRCEGADHEQNLEFFLKCHFPGIS